MPNFMGVELEHIGTTQQNFINERVKEIGARYEKAVERIAKALKYASDNLAVQMQLDKSRMAQNDAMISSAVNFLITAPSIVCPWIGKPITMMANGIWKGDLLQVALGATTTVRDPNDPMGESHWQSLFGAVTGIEIGGLGQDRGKIDFVGHDDKTLPGEKEYRTENYLNHGYMALAQKGAYQYGLLLKYAAFTEVGGSDSVPGAALDKDKLMDAMQAKLDPKKMQEVIGKLKIEADLSTLELMTTSLETLSIGRGTWGALHFALANLATGVKLEDHTGLMIAKQLLLDSKRKAEVKVTDAAAGSADHIKIPRTLDEIKENPEFAEASKIGKKSPAGYFMTYFEKLDPEASLYKEDKAKLNEEQINNLRVNKAIFLAYYEDVEKALGSTIGSDTKDYLKDKIEKLYNAETQEGINAKMPGNMFSSATTTGFGRYGLLRGVGKLCTLGFNRKANVHEHARHRARYCLAYSAFYKVLEIHLGIPIPGAYIIMNGDTLDKWTYAMYDALHIYALILSKGQPDEYSKWVMNEDQLAANELVMGSFNPLSILFAETGLTEITGADFDVEAVNGVSLTAEYISSLNRRDDVRHGGKPNNIGLAGGKRIINLKEPDFDGLINRGQAEEAVYKQTLKRAINTHIEEWKGVFDRNKTQIKDMLLKMKGTTMNKGYKDLGGAEKDLAKYTAYTNMCREKLGGDLPAGIISGADLTAQLDGRSEAFQSLMASYNVSRTSLFMTSKGKESVETSLKHMHNTIKKLCEWVEANDRGSINNLAKVSSQAHQGILTLGQRLRNHQNNINSINNDLDAIKDAKPVIRAFKEKFGEDWHK